MLRQVLWELSTAEVPNGRYLRPLKCAPPRSPVAVLLPARPQRLRPEVLCISLHDVPSIAHHNAAPGAVCARNSAATALTQRRRLQPAATLCISWRPILGANPTRGAPILP